MPDQLQKSDARFEPVLWGCTLCHRLELGGDQGPHYPECGIYPGCMRRVVELDPAPAPRSEAEALAEALEEIEGSPRAGIGCPHQKIARDVLTAYRARHPKETP